MTSETCHKAKRAYYPSLDVAKLFCALLVVIIHTSPLQNISPIATFYLVDVLARVAVPLFFAISAFLFFGKLTYTDGKIERCTQNHKKLLRYLKRTALLYLLWSIVYILARLPHWYASGWWGVTALKDAVVSFFCSGSYYHLWFLLSLIYALPLLYVILTKLSKSHLIVLIAIFWLFECLHYSYSWILPSSFPILDLIDQRIPIAFTSLFRTLPLLGIGALCIDMPTQNPPRHLGIKVFMAFASCAAEASFLYFFSPNQSAYSYLICTPFLAYYGLLFLLSCKQHHISSSFSQICRDVSLTLYCLHPFIIDCFTHFGIPKGLLMWIGVTITTSAIAILWFYMKNLLRMRYDFS